MVNTEKLKLAKSNYRSGMVIKSLITNITHTIRFINTDQDDDNRILAITVEGSAYVYYENQWAEIISSPPKIYELWR